PVVWVVWNNYAYASIRGLQRGYLEGRELATDFHHPATGQPYNPDFAAMARSAGVEGVSVDRAAGLASEQARIRRTPCGRWNLSRGIDRFSHNVMMTLI